MNVQHPLHDTENLVKPESGRDGAWYALHVRERYESCVATHLRGRGYAAFLPLYTTRRRWSDRLKEIQLPLFPGYVFCQFDLQSRLPILTIPGVVHIVGFGKTAVPVDEGEITALRAADQSGLARRPWPYLRTGQRVKIECGPLCGLEGVLLDFKGAQRLVLSVTLLQRSVAVELEEQWVRPVPQCPSRGGLASAHPPWS
jgi:transcription antitermination factor NusG